MSFPNHNANTCPLQASRLDLAERFDVSQRDLSLVDPWVPLRIPVSFLVRKHSILANLGAIRVMISRCEVRTGQQLCVERHCSGASVAYCYAAVGGGLV
jgi:hypothetical protein